MKIPTLTKLSDEQVSLLTTASLKQARFFDTLCSNLGLTLSELKYLLTIHLEGLDSVSTAKDIADFERAADAKRPNREKGNIKVEPAPFKPDPARIPTIQKFGENIIDIACPYINKHDLTKDELTWAMQGLTSALVNSLGEPDIHALISDILDLLTPNQKASK